MVQVSSFLHRLLTVIHTYSTMSISDDEFQAAADFLTSTPAAASLSNDEKLEVSFLHDEADR